MPRQQRIYVPGGIFHLTGLAVAEEPLFRTDLDRHDFLALVRGLSRRIDWQIVTWCLMSTHYHLLVALRRQTHVSQILQRLNGTYAVAHNARYGRRGHLFGSRYGYTPVEDGEHLDATIPYILENPVRAGLVARVEDWRWSGLDLLHPRPRPLRVPPPPRRQDSRRHLRREAA